MAERINLATLDLDLQGLIKATMDGKAAIQALKKEQQELKKSGDYNSAQFIRNEVELKRLAQVYRIQTNAIQAQVSAGGRLESQEMAIATAIGRENNSVDDLKENNKQLIALRNKLNINDENYLKTLNEINAKIDQNTATMKENVSAQEKQRFSIGDYKNQIIEAYRELEKEKNSLVELNDTLKEHRDTLEKDSEEWKILNQQINHNITQINVYTSNLEEARGEQNGFSEALGLSSGGLSNFVQKSKEAGGTGPLLTNVFNGLKAGLIGATKAGLAFIATPIGAAIAALAATVALVVGAFKFMQASMNSTEEGSQRLARVMAGLNGFFNTFWKIIKPLGEWLGKYFIAYIEGIGVALDKLSTGVANTLEFLGFDKAAENIRGVKEEFKQSAEAAYNLSKAEGELQIQQRKSAKLQLDYQKQAEKLRQQRDDESKSIGERKKLNEQLGAVLKKQSDDELAIAYKQLEVAKLRIKSEGETTEARDKRAEAETRIAEIQERITSQESEQLANLNSLRKESADKAIENQKRIQEARQKALDDAVTKMKLEYDIFLQNEGDKAKLVEERLALAETVRKKEMEIAQAEFNKSKKTEIDKLNLIKATNDAGIKYAEATTAAVVDNADMELKAVIETNKSKLDNTKFINDAILQAELSRLDTIAEAEKDNLKVRFDNNLLSLQEYNAAVAEIDSENNKKQQELQQQRKDAETQRQLIDIENKKAADDITFNEKLALDLEKLEIQKQQELQEADKTGADKAAILQKYAKLEKDIIFAKEQSERDQYAQTFGQAAELLGKRTIAGKAAAIAEATINTYSGIAQVWASDSILPEPFATIQKVVSTGVVLQSGLKAVNTIKNTKTPKAEKGALFSIGGKRHSQGGTMFTGADGTRFEAEQGEIIGVMNRNAARHFMAFNNAFPAGGQSYGNYFASGGIVSREIAKPDVNVDDLAMKLAAAIQNAPTPVVYVETIAEVGGKVFDVKSNSGL